MPLPSAITMFLANKNKGCVRLCTLRKSHGASTFGFAVHCKRGRSSKGRHFVVCSVFADSPAERSGLRCGDHILAVNGSNVFDELYTATMQRLKAAWQLESVKLLVADPESFAEYFALRLPMNAQLPGTVVVAEPLLDTGCESSCEGRTESQNNNDISVDSTPKTAYNTSQQSQLELHCSTEKHSEVKSIQQYPAVEQRSAAPLSPATEQQCRATQPPAAEQRCGAPLSPAIDQQCGAPLSPTAEQQCRATQSPTTEQRRRATQSPAAEQECGTTQSPAAAEQQCGSPLSTAAEKQCGVTQSPSSESGTLSLITCRPLSLVAEQQCGVTQSVSSESGTSSFITCRQSPLSPNTETEMLPPTINRHMPPPLSPETGTLERQLPPHLMPDVEPGMLSPTSDTSDRQSVTSMSLDHDTEIREPTSEEPRSVPQTSDQPVTKSEEEKEATLSPDNEPETPSPISEQLWKSAGPYFPTTEPLASSPTASRDLGCCFPILARGHPLRRLFKF